MIWTIDLALAAVGLPVLGAALYLLVATVLWRAPKPLGTRGQTRFVVLVPAYNEAQGIGATVRSLQAADYPRELVRLVVIADNCTDATAAVAVAHGAEVLERADAERRGKGYALRFGIDQLLREPQASWDALVVVDGDSSVDPAFFHGLAASIEVGEQAVQAVYLPRPGGRTSVSVITHVAFVAFHLVRSAARERLGLSCGLRGNGMAFTRALLDAVPHTSFSRTEDLEFGIQLGLQGIRVAFADGARVYGDMPDVRGAVRSQRERWIGGRCAMVRRFAVPLFRRACRHRDVVAADLAMDLFVPPVSVLVATAVCGLALDTAVDVMTLARGYGEVVYGPALAALAVHVSHAARVSGQGRAFLRASLALPSYALDKALTTFRVAARTDETWVRTPRKGEL